MEEILASIRSIIADDREPPPKPAAKPVAAPAGPQIVYSKDDSALRAIEPPPVEATSPKVVWSAPQPAAAPLSAPAASPRPSISDMQDVDAGGLLSPQADEAVTAAFEALSAGLAMQSAELAENMTREILRPMLKTWLDENLPSLVERLVRAEIQRVARGGR
ncbi:MAG: DUF2497 domain-containing protein [Bradyrhizobium sp.]|nr:MAG: DUF2497 domain-containing protein [Bradyrhizobium sp.]